MRNRLLPISLLAAAALCGTLALASVDPAAGTLAQAAPTETPAPPRYGAPSIVAPGKEQTIHDNTGRVPIEVALRPPLDTRQGHRLQVVLDGRLLPERWSATRFALQGIDRGTHRLEVIVTDRAGNELARSDAVEFHLWQASRLFRQRAPQ